MKCIVTGGCGFIGSNLVDELLRQNHEVIIIDNLSSNAFHPQFGYDHLDLLHKDINHDFEIESDVDVIFHLAAQSRVNPSFDNPCLTMETNVVGTTRMLEIAKKKNARFVYAGSSSFYGDPHKNPYALSKWFGEEVALMYNQLHKVPVGIARFFNVYGPRQPSEGSNATVIGIFEQQKKQKKNLTVTGTGLQKRDFVHVSDVVSGLIAMSKDKWNGEIFNFGCGKNYSINQVANLYEGRIEYIPARQGEAQENLADISFAKDKLSWTPKIDLEDYIEDFLNANFPITSDPVVMLWNKFKKACKYTGM
jgi:UDP-glucose 4-epimerase